MAEIVRIYIVVSEPQSMNDATSTSCGYAPHAPPDR